jgi:hypothetical protein
MCLFVSTNDCANVSSEDVTHPNLSVVKMKLQGSVPATHSFYHFTTYSTNATPVAPEITVTPAAIFMG